MEVGLHADRSNISATAAAGVGIVHLGLGAFFRAFGVPWICETMQASGGNWAVIGVSLRSSAVRDGLKSQSYDYTAMELGPKGEICRRIEGLRDVLVAPENPAVVLSAMVDPAVKIVSLTVTEKGYCHNPATGRLDFDHADIRVDLSNEMPRSALGFIVRALQRRRAAGDDPFTVMSCDNLPNNGELTRGLILDLAREVDADLAMWISSEVCFPSTMVDRIVPATKPEDVERVTILTGIVDASPVVHEPFRQWVIEDNFVGRNRPDFGAVGIEMVQDVTPFEHMKLRMLNGTHSAMAYLGYLAGHQTIAEVANDPVFERYVKNLWVSEIIPALTAPKGVDLQGYAGQLFARYSNPFIRHLTWQIAMDGSQKLPQRILSNLSENITAGRQSRRLLLAVAGWIRYIGGTDEQGNPIEVSDPLAQRLRDLSGQAEGAGKAIAILGVQEVFPDKLSAEIGPGVCLAYERLLAVGARNAVEEIG
jgi:fructuronate reductase